MEWHSPPVNEALSCELTDVVISLLTEPVTRSLPPMWQGEYSKDRARHWIEERDEDGTTLLVIDKQSQQPVGLVILAEMPSDTKSGADVRLGYLLSESTWGKRIASELVIGFTEWCRQQSYISHITAGVATDNPASKRVLQKAGFDQLPATNDSAGDEELFRMELH